MWNTYSTWRNLLSLTLLFVVFYLILSAAFINFSSAMTALRASRYMTADIMGNTAGISNEKSLNRLEDSSVPIYMRLNTKYTIYHPAISSVLNTQKRACAILLLYMNIEYSPEAADMSNMANIGHTLKSWEPSALAMQRLYSLKTDVSMPSPVVKVPMDRLRQHTENTTASSRYTVCMR